MHLIDGQRTFYIGGVKFIGGSSLQAHLTSLYEASLPAKPAPAVVDVPVEPVADIVASDPPVAQPDHAHGHKKSHHKK